MDKRLRLGFFKTACFSLFIMLFTGNAYAQKAQVVFDKLPSVEPRNIKVFVDSSRSMGGFFSESVGIAKGVYEWFNHLSTIKPSNSKIEYFGFASHASRIPIEGASFMELLTRGSVFHGQDNIYSIAFDTIIEEIGKGDSIGIVLTDGVPSVISRGSIDQQLQNERNRIGNAFKKFLERKSDNQVLIFRFLFPYVGNYYSSDNSFRELQVNGARNFYAIVFCENKHISFIDKMFDFDKFHRYDIKRQSFTDYDKIRIESCNTSIVNDRISFSLITNSPETTNSDVKIINAQETEVPADKSIEAGKIVFRVKFTKEEIQNHDSFKIVFGPRKLDPFFKNLNIEAGHESDIVHQRSDFHSKTFRLSFLTDALENNYNNSYKQRNALAIGFRIKDHNQHWQRFFEPLFGLLPPQPADEKFYTGATFPLFLLRWLTPICSALFIYLVCFNRKSLNIRNHRTQKAVWTTGLLINLVLSSGLTFLIISKPDYCVKLTLGYYLKYILYDTLFSLLLYFLLSLFLRRIKNSIAQNVPF
ncbi:MAG: hypothetical protein INR73_03145 [Williamsia sp.]|nr:hypothetical protein [Williamsia sp.]